MIQTGQLRNPEKFPVRLVINLVMFQLVWFATVLGVTWDRPWLGPAALGCFLSIHFFLARTAVADYIIAIIALIFGLFVETAYIQAGVLRYELNLPWPGLAPFWLLVLWANLALTLNNGLGWLQGRYKAAAMLGFFGGPLSYLGGVVLGAGQLEWSPIPAFLVFAISWAAIVPLLLLIARRLTNNVTNFFNQEVTGQ